VSITPSNLKRVFFTNSGTESMEAAIKFARISTGRTDFICAERAFHGRTLGALSATYKAKYKEGFEPLIPGFHFVPFNRIEAIQEADNGKIAGIILEVVQGEGGIHVGDDAYFKAVRRYCDERGLLLILDEIQSGFCRTGRMFACNHFDLESDILCLAKSIAGGVPMGAVVCSDRIQIPKGKHGTTFGGNPLAAAAARATIQTLVRERLDIAAKDKGDRFVRLLQELSLPKILDIRHLGLMIGIELDRPVLPILLVLQEKGVLAFPAGESVIRLLPPLIISDSDLERVAVALGDALK
jgi:acetylornithine/LysW-gamma-L-lysine aminotransferase